jgi:hypothetical protein
LASTLRQRPVFTLAVGHEPDQKRCLGAGKNPGEDAERNEDPRRFPRLDDLAGPAGRRTRTSVVQLKLGGASHQDPDFIRYFSQDGEFGALSKPDELGAPEATQEVVLKGDKGKELHPASEDCR